jgi:16S rRNA (guanine527-N7)-methyltransferase
MLSMGASSLGISFSEKSGKQLFLYFQELKRWGKKINLISKESHDPGIIENHFVDSLALLSVLEPEHELLADIGSGAGFPGLACKIARPEMGVRLLEPRLKRVSFLRHVIRTLGLEDITVLAVRLEDGVRLLDEMKFTCVVGRAVTSLGAFLQMCSRWRRPGCRVICMKGPRYREELEEAGSVVSGWSLTDIREYKLPSTQASRAILVFETGQKG